MGFRIHHSVGYKYDIGLELSCESAFWGLTLNQGRNLAPLRLPAADDAELLSVSRRAGIAPSAGFFLPAI